MNTFFERRTRFVQWLCALGCATLMAGTAQAADPAQVSFTLEGCRNDGSISLPNASGVFVCPDAAYTTGNLGKGWNELDLVPYRITASAGNSAPTAQTYTIAAVLDFEDAGKPGYDLMSVPVLNTAKSHASCTAPVVQPATLPPAGALDTPGLGGIAKSLFRLVTITQAKNTNCVYDYYGRLALGSHLFPGSSLHANLALPTTGDDDGLPGGGSSGLAVDLNTQGIGARDVSIPVREISPQELRKDMAAQAASDYAWNLTKVVDKAKINFGDVCAAGAPAPQAVKVRVEWTRGPAIAGKVTVTTNIYARNPASRTITVNVTDTIYKGNTQTTPLDTLNSGDQDVPANTEVKVLTHTAVLDASAGSVGDLLNDVAYATYIDKATGIPVPGTTTATASATIGTGSLTNTTANIADLEKIDLANPANRGLSFSVASPAVGSFIDYTAGTPTNLVQWGATGLTSSGFVEFDKLVYLDGRRIVNNGELQDVASLVTTDGDVSLTAGPIFVAISSDAKVSFTLSKAIPVILGTGESIEVKFLITRSNDPSFQMEKTITFVAGGPLTLSTELTGLVPDLYTVEETSSTFYAPGGPAGGVPSKLLPVGGPLKTVDLSTVDGVVTQCTGSVTYVNTIPADQFPKAQVQKITLPAIGSSDPDYLWTFTLAGPGIPGGSIAAQAGANAGYVTFDVDLQEPGSYTVTETPKAPLWALTSAAPDPSGTKVCSFQVKFPQDIGALKQCTFTNTKQGQARVVKTVLNQPPSGTQQFTFQLRQGASSTLTGTTLETQVATAGNGGLLNFSTYLVPGNTYQLCEIVMPGWLTSLGNFVPNAFMPPDGQTPNPNVDNSILCGDFTATPGQTVVFTIDNSPPPGGRALTIGFWKNWASCKASGGNQAPTLDRTMALAEPTGIQVNSFFLHGSTANPDVAPDCAQAVSLLSKRNFAGLNRASDPLFNMAAQLVAAELNLAAGAYNCPLVSTAIVSANALLTKYGFNGTGYTGRLSPADASSANSLAKRLDDYNNNRPSACQ